MERSRVAKRSPTIHIIARFRPSVNGPSADLYPLLSRKGNARLFRCFGRCTSAQTGRSPANAIKHRRVGHCQPRAACTSRWKLIWPCHRELTHGARRHSIQNDLCPVIARRERFFATDEAIPLCSSGHGFADALDRHTVISSAAKRSPPMSRGDSHRESPWRSFVARRVRSLLGMTGAPDTVFPPKSILYPTATSLAS